MNETPVTLWLHPSLLDTASKVRIANDIERKRGSKFRYKLGDHCQWSIATDRPHQLAALPGPLSTESR